MPLLTPNHEGIRNIIPKAVRDYFSLETKLDNINFGQPELDKELLRIYREVKAGSTFDFSKNIVIDNVLVHADAYLYALRTIIRKAKHSIKIFTQQLDQRMLDGTPLFTDPDIIDAAVKFLSNSNARLEILFRDRPDETLLDSNTLITELRGRQNLSIYYSENTIVKTCGCTFVGADDRIYNLRFRNYAIINFNNQDYSKRISEIFVRVRELSSTSILRFGADNGIERNNC
jgi:hypothetical protein